jgi:hypothetical protein
VWTQDPGFADWRAGNFRFTGSDPELRQKLAFLNDLFDAGGSFVPAAEAGIQK